jgi:hypothetical protein
MGFVCKSGSSQKSIKSGSKKTTYVLAKHALFRTLFIYLCIKSLHPGHTVIALMGGLEIFCF